MATILVVDNASFMRSSLKYLCELAGHTVIGMAANGREAIRLYKELKPEIVTMDIIMEDMDGIQALAEIKEGRSVREGHNGNSHWPRGKERGGKEAWRGRVHTEAL